MHFEVNTAARTEQPEQATCHDLATKRNAPAPGPGGNETGGRRQVGGAAGGAQGGTQDEHPQPGNTGVRDTSEGAKALIDWVGVTFKQLPLAEVLELFGGEREWLPTRGGMRYRSGLMRGNVRVYWDGLDEEEMGVHVEASGRGCRQLEAEGVVHHWSKFFEAALKDGAEFSRLDLAADDLAGVIPFQESVAKTKADHVTRRSDCWRVFECGRRSSAEVGQTLMLGSGSSDTQLRIYDKTAEQAQKGKTPVGEWVRCEAQFRNERAQIAAQVLAAEGEGAIAGLIAGLVDFKEPGQDSNKARWKRCAWWSAFLGLVETIRLTVQPEDRSVEQVADWIKRQVGPSLSLLSVAQGYGSEWLLDLVESSFGRLREGHLRMLGMCRQPAPEGGW